ncbi:MAG: large-conductance mechanosensitive channel protein MscL [Clostridiales Family XIII bacterium]|nr:large-conductance mechanosensitive channel protein MscL [Clostridiales Family XIII bacterium]
MKKNKGFIHEFKEFALRGNVVDMAIGIVIGAAFSTIVNSFVNDIIMPLIGAITSGKDFSSLGWKFGPEATDVLRYGTFIQAILNFFIIALAIFTVVKISNKAFNLNKEKEDPEPPPPTETELLAEIRDLLKDEKGG